MACTGASTGKILTILATSDSKPQGSHSHILMTGGGGGVRVIFFGSEILAKGDFFGSRKEKTEEFFGVARKELGDFLGYAKKSSDLFG